MACWVRPESRFFWIRIQKNLDSGLPGLADRHLRENTVFPDLLISISGKSPVSPTCYFILSSLQRAEKYFGLRSSRRAASARLPPVFRSALSMIAFLQVSSSVA